MKSAEGVQKFIEYKRNVEKERPSLTSEPRLITIDGIDGTGKSTVAKKLVEKLQERFGGEKVVLAILLLKNYLPPSIFRKRKTGMSKIVTPVITTQF